MRNWLNKILVRWGFIHLSKDESEKIYIALDAYMCLYKSKSGSDIKWLTLGAKIGAFHGRLK